MTGIRPKYELKITLDPPTAGNVDGAGFYIEGKRVNVNVTTLPGWEFIEWIGDISDTSSNLEITMDKDIAIIAKFKSKFQLSPFIISLSLTSLILLIINIACIFKISHDKKTIDTLKQEKLSLNTEITGLNSEITQLKQEKIGINSEITQLKREVETLKAESIDYTLYEGELTSSKNQNNYLKYIPAPKIVEAYLFDMTDDADLEILNESSNISMAKSIKISNTPDIINIRIESTDSYAFKVSGKATKYKLKIYIHN